MASPAPCQVQMLEWVVEQQSHASFVSPHELLSMHGTYGHASMRFQFHGNWALLLGILELCMVASITWQCHSVTKCWSYLYEIATKNGIIFRSPTVVIPIDIRRNLVARANASHVGILNTINVNKCSTGQEAQPAKGKDLLMTNPLPKSYAKLPQMTISS